MGYRDEIRDRAARALQEWVSSPAWFTVESDPETVAEIAWSVDHQSGEEIILEAAVHLGYEIADRVRAAMHEWGDPVQCSLISSKPGTMCPSRCLKCGVRLVCDANPGCYHYLAWPDAEVLPPCRPR